MEGLFYSINSHNKSNKKRIKNNRVSSSNSNSNYHISYNNKVYRVGD